MPRIKKSEQVFGLPGIRFYIQIPVSRSSVFPGGTRETDVESMEEHDLEALMALLEQEKTVLMIWKIYPPTLKSSFVLKVTKFMQKTCVCEKHGRLFLADIRWYYLVSSIIQVLNITFYNSWIESHVNFLWLKKDFITDGNLNHNMFEISILGFKNLINHGQVSLFCIWHKNKNIQFTSGFI